MLELPRACCQDCVGLPCYQARLPPSYLSSCFHLALLVPGSIFRVIPRVCDVCRGLLVQLPPKFYKSRILFIQPNPSQALAWQLSSSQCRRYLLLGSKKPLCWGVTLTPQEPTLLSVLRGTQQKPSQGSVETMPSHVFPFPWASSSIGLLRLGRVSIPLIPN